MLELLESTDTIRASATALKTLGSLTQALRYVGDMGEVWRGAGAIEWLGAGGKEWTRDMYFTATRRVIRIAQGSAQPEDYLEELDR